MNSLTNLIATNPVMAIGLGLVLAPVGLVLVRRTVNACNVLAASVVDYLKEAPAFLARDLPKVVRKLRS
jgi:hypothetical protein